MSFSHIRWWLLVFLLCFGGILVVGTPAPGRAAPAMQGACEGIPLAHGCFFSQTANDGGGYSVTDDGQARFWAEYQRLGGSQTVGYPISRRFIYDGFTTQAFQKLVLQWRPEAAIAYPMNIFDELSEAGLDEALYTYRQTPYPLVNFDPPNATWAQIVAARQGLLASNRAIQSRYFSVNDPLNVFGLPMSRVEDMGNHYAVRTQRAVFQQWKESVPWAQVGQVTIANGGDIAKEFSWFDPAWLVAEPAPGAPIPPAPTPAPPPPYPRWQPNRLIVGTEGHLYLLQKNRLDESRLLVSTDQGASWTPFPAEDLPHSNTPCFRGVAPGYSRHDDLYAIACDGVYRWDGSRWLRVISRADIQEIVVAPDNPTRLWAIAGDRYEEGDILTSTDSGQSWTVLIEGELAPTQLSVDHSTGKTLYFLSVNCVCPTSVPHLNRGKALTPAPAESLGLVQPELDNTLQTFTVDPRTGNLYALLYNLEHPTVWRTTNADTPDIEDIRWQPRSTAFTLDFYPIALSSGYTNDDQFVLYAVIQNIQGEGGVVYELAFSLDQGATWQPISTPSER